MCVPIDTNSKNAEEQLKSYHCPTSPPRTVDYDLHMCFTTLKYFSLRQNPGNNFLVLIFGIEGLSNFQMWNNFVQHVNKMHLLRIFLSFPLRRTSRRSPPSAARAARKRLPSAAAFPAAVAGKAALPPAPRPTPEAAAASGRADTRSTSLQILWGVVLRYF